MGKIRTSIYIDQSLWQHFKEMAFKKGLEPSNLLEELIKEALTNEAIDNMLTALIDSEDYELDFRPVKPREGTVSALIRVMRDERASGIP